MVLHDSPFSAWTDTPKEGERAANGLMVHLHFQHWKKRVTVVSSSFLLSKWYIVSLHKETGLLLWSPLFGLLHLVFLLLWAFNPDQVHFYTCMCDFLNCGAVCLGDFFKCATVRKWHRFLLSMTLLCERKRAKGNRGSVTPLHKDDGHCGNCPHPRHICFVSCFCKRGMGCTHLFLYTFS